MAFLSEFQQIEKKKHNIKKIYIVLSATLSKQSNTKCKQKIYNSYLPILEKFYIFVNVINDMCR